MKRKVTRSVYKLVKSLLEKGYSGRDIQAVLPEESVGYLSSATISRIKRSKNRRGYLLGWRKIRKHNKSFKVMSIAGIPTGTRVTLIAADSGDVFTGTISGIPSTKPTVSIVAASYALTINGETVTLSRDEMLALVEDLKLVK